MQTIAYEYEGALYVNLTNRCDCACVFCLRHNGHKGSMSSLSIFTSPGRVTLLAARAMLLPFTPAMFICTAVSPSFKT